MKDRLKQFIDYIGVKNYTFEKKIGVSEGTLRRFFGDKNGLTVGTLEKIADIYPQLSLDWLITGRGSMLYEDNKPKEEPSLAPAPTPNPQPISEQITILERLYDRLISEKDAHILDLQNRITAQAAKIDLLSAAHKDLVDSSEKMLLENNRLLHQGTRILNNINATQVHGFAHGDPANDTDLSTPSIRALSDPLPTH